MLLDCGCFSHPRQLSSASDDFTNHLNSDPKPTRSTRSRLELRFPRNRLHVIRYENWTLALGFIRTQTLTGFGKRLPYPLYTVHWCIALPTFTCQSSTLGFLHALHACRPSKISPVSVSTVPYTNLSESSPPAPPTPRLPLWHHIATPKLAQPGWASPWFLHTLPTTVVISGPSYELLFPMTDHTVPRSSASPSTFHTSLMSTIRDIH